MASELPSVRATKIVEQRQGQYGHPGDIYEDVAKMWNIWLRIEGTEEVIAPIQATDVAMMQALLKICRERSKHLEDNEDDVCGYMNVRRMIRDWEVTPYEPSGTDDRTS